MTAAIPLGDVSARSVHPAHARTYPGLDVLRGWGAIAVVFFHSGVLTGIPIFKSCHLAVDMFYVMSGFIIAHAYDRKIPVIGILGFLRVRVIRFYPLLVLGLMFGVIRSLVLIPFSHAHYGVRSVIEALGLSLCFLPSPPFLLSTTEISPLDIPAWTLIFEMAINVVYILLFRWLSVRVLIALVAVAFFVLVPTLLNYDGVNPGPNWPGFGGGLARVCFSFPVGVLLYRLDPPPIKLGFLVIPGLLALVSLGGTPWIDVVFTVVGAPFLVMIAAHAVPRWSKLAAYLGQTSYCIYAIHAPILALVFGFSHRLGVSVLWPIAATIASLLLICPFLDRWYDRPVRRWLGMLGKPRRLEPTVG